MNLHPRAASPLLAILALTLAGACGGVDDAESTSQSIPVESEFGEVEIPREPEAALGMYTTDVDVLLTLGYPLAREQPIRDVGYDQFPSFLDPADLEGVTPFANFPDYDFEKISGAEPDFILNSLGYDDQVVDTLPKIAPTFSYNGFDGASWIEHFEQTAAALDRTEQFQEWVASYEERLSEVKEAIGDVSDLVAAPVGYIDGGVESACNSSTVCSVLDDLGIAVYEPATETEGITLSPEKLDELSDVDIAFMPETPGADGSTVETAVSELDQNAQWRQLGFVQNDAVVAYDFELNFGSPSGQMAFLDLLEQELAR